ncbi:hypothetical protein Ahy_B05g076927 [Arachis hypogaea]|uniref:Uncharacterized protein n=1 Tax=Arachis hypogaea TaxID=3818 RepID=A0A444Z456_ARAHY|nr:hypothetical protein Ahy_B05g076927 [Arachis hypogaea]
MQPRASVGKLSYLQLFSASPEQSRSTSAPRSYAHFNLNPVYEIPIVWLLHEVPERRPVEMSDRVEEYQMISDNNRDIEQGYESQPHQAQSGVVCPTCGKHHGSRLCRSDNNRDIEQGHESQPHQAQSGVVCPTCGKHHGSRLCRFRTGW